MIFTVKIADVPIEIHCRQERNKDFFIDYLCEEEAFFPLEPTLQDLEQADWELKEAAAKEGKTNVRLTAWSVENTAIHGLLANALIDFNVLLVHGSAVVMDGQAYIFMANSGTGKSTHTRLWREAFGDRAWMLNDDKPMLRKTENGILVYGSPWDGKHHLNRNASAPLKALIKLSRSKKNTIEPMSKADALAMLLEHALRANNPENMEKILRLETYIVNRSELFNLYCNMEPEAALVAWQGINRKE